MASAMPMVGTIKKHSDAVVEGAAFRTPVRRSVRQKVSPSERVSINSDTSTGIISVATSTPGSAVMEVEDGSATSTTNKRKRQSIGGSTIKSLADCYLSTNKKRPRTSLSGPSTPGKAIPMDHTRERDVAKRFVELEVTEVYRAIRKQTGALGGNAAGGAIYGEITQNSFQRVVDYMKEHCELSKASRFLDVGSGLGKPNLHVAIDPGVEVSYGVELEELRWHLSLHNLKSVLQLDINKNKDNRAIFTAGDITQAKSFNPFSHVYSFDVGFPPGVMDHMAEIFNISDAKYFASFHPPRKVIDVYGFDVDNIGRVATSMAGSNEGHTCYFYRRSSADEMEISPAGKENTKRRRSTEPPKTEDTPTAEPGDFVHIDPLFRPGFDVLNRGKDGVLAWIVAFFGEQHEGGRTRRQKRTLQTKKKQERPLESYYRIVGKARVASRSPKK